MTRSALMKICSCLILFALCLACFLWVDGALESEMNGGVSAAEKTNEERISSLARLLDDGDATTIELAQGCFDRSFKSEIPPAFSIEALDARAFEEAYVSESTISLIYDGSPSDAQSYCKGALEKKGWRSFDENNQLVSTFAKSSGTYRWLCLQYLAIDETTVILIDPIKN